MGSPILIGNLKSPSPCHNPDSMPKRRYITTPIYYVNGAPHIGTALTTAVCDFDRRYRIMRGEPVWFLTGTDENATKVVEAAEAAGKETMPFVDEMAQRFRDEWSYLGIEPEEATAIRQGLRGLNCACTASNSFL